MKLGSALAWAVAGLAAAGWPRVPAGWLGAAGTHALSNGRPKVVAAAPAAERRMNPRRLSARRSAVTRHPLREARRWSQGPVYASHRGLSADTYTPTV